MKIITEQELKLQEETLYQFIQAEIERKCLSLRCYKPWGYARRIIKLPIREELKGFGLFKTGKFFAIEMAYISFGPDNYEITCAKEFFDSVLKSILDSWNKRKGKKDDRNITVILRDNNVYFKDFTKDLNINGPYEY